MAADQVHHAAAADAGTSDKETGKGEVRSDYVMGVPGSYWSSAVNFNYTSDTPWGVSLVRHGERANMLFADFHVETVQPGGDLTKLFVTTAE